MWLLALASFADFVRELGQQFESLLRTLLSNIDFALYGMQDVTAPLTHRHHLLIPIIIVKRLLAMTDAIL